ncbi:PAS domain-containing hybrid sensor histidine kinase/response regulator [Corallococcus llansteffanensis]|uniref:histidine kinase n=1 Tax=Corallococcus llansteffanensis TaxID=2316731 RepID=A0A3A8QIK6_9BACT|nr:PAS domain S-box protein [Corallococcus llansteffanensis]RKH68543.1 PAS domain S-box protein [Corallococcus llansteffanensis]
MSPAPHPDFLDGEGELRARIRAFDWARTPLGPLGGWPDVLRTTLELVLGSTTPLVLLWGAEGVLLYNDAFAVVAEGMHPGLLGMPALEGWPEMADFNRHVLATTFAGGTVTLRDEPLVLTRNGVPEHVWMDLDYSPVRDTAGRPVGALAVVRETTARVRLERQLRDNESRMRFALKAGRLGSWELDLTTLTLTASATCKANFGRGPEAPLSYEELQAAIHPEDVGRMRAAVARMLQARVESDLDTRVVWPDGSVHWVSMQARPLPGPDGRVARLMGASRDITERRQAEAGLRELNETLEARVTERTAERDLMWRLSHDLMIVVALEHDGHIIAANPAWERLLGWKEAELVGTPVVNFIHPDDLAHSTAYVEALHDEASARRTDNRYRHKDGRWRWISWSAVETGQGTLMALGRDVTEERESREALAHAETALRQAQKMEAVGQLTGGIAHDFNNLLQGIVGSLGLLQKRLHQGRTLELDRFITSAMSSAQRAAALTHRLLAFSRLQPLDPKPVKVNPLVSSMEDLLRRTLGEQMQLELVLAGGLWLTRCDPNQLETAVLNLAINARDAMPGGGKLTVETCNAHLDAAYAARLRGVAPGQYVCVSVSDTGTGMTPEVLERAFEPFFTTKPLGQGTGLGLSMIYGFARQSEGSVQLYSQAGQGTTVKLYLPRYVGERKAEEAQEPGGLTDAHVAEAGETVLVVEDEEVIRALIVEVLRELGYRALEAGDGTEGLRLLRSTPRLDLLVTDMGLPGLNGRQLAEVGRSERPGLKVLFMTGYAENAAVASGFLEPGMAMMTKPFAMEALATRIRDMIQQR